MHFLPDMTIPCEACGGTRYRREILDVRYRGHSIADVLELNIEQARKLFSSFPRVRAPLKTIEDVGLSYLKLGQSSTTLSGGEAQRLKLASELSRKHAGHTVYILDEPTTGLHFADISRLMDVLNRLARQDSTLIIIEHNLDVVQCADWVIDLGPEGGTGGGQVVCQGPPEAIAACEASHTGRFLKELFAQRAKNRAVAADA
jgi:excinuclease ABC subunit A